MVHADKKNKYSLTDERVFTDTETGTRCHGNGNSLTGKSVLAESEMGIR